MKPIKILALLTLSACLLTPVDAADKDNQADRKKSEREMDRNARRARKEEKKDLSLTNDEQNARFERQERKMKRAENDKKQGDFKYFMQLRDKNNDGSLSIDEFLAMENDKEAGRNQFDRYNKNGDRVLSKVEIEAMLGL